MAHPIFSVMKDERMKQAQYPIEAKDEYYIFRFDEEVSIGRIDIHRLITTHRISDKDFVEGMPLYPKGNELLACKL